jgi:hypothetical protein
MVNPEMMAAMAAMAAKMSPAQSAELKKTMAEAQSRMADVDMQAKSKDSSALAGATMAMPPIDPMMEQEGDQGISLSSNLVADLKRSKTIVRGLRWTPGTADISPGSIADFNRNMTRLVAAMKQAGGGYRLDLYMDQQSANIVVQTLGTRRLRAVQEALSPGGIAQGPGALQLGEIRKDEDPRLEIVRLK